MPRDRAPRLSDEKIVRDKKGFAFVCVLLPDGLVGELQELAKGRRDLNGYTHSEPFQSCRFLEEVLRKGLSRVRTLRKLEERRAARVKK